MYSKDTNGQILYVRHGITEYNKMLEILPHKQVQLCNKYIDCKLAKEGQDQAKMLNKELSTLNLKYVFCSPLNRCLETAFISLKDHPNVDQIEIIVYPLLSEVIHGSQDLPIDLKGKKAKYNEFSEIKVNWQYFDEIVSDFNQDNYFLSFLDNGIENNDIIEIINKIKRKSDDNYLIELLSKYLNANKRPESLKHLFNRNIEFKEFLKKFLLNKPINKDEKVVVITHSAFIRMSSSLLGVTKDNCYPDDCYRSGNCEVVSIKI
jgi:broad specificity phosphatase PhoE